MCFSLKAQTPTLHDPNNSFINDRVEENNPMGLLWWHCDSMSPYQMFTTYKAHTGLGTNDNMVIARQWNDEQVCLAHVLYEHKYKGITVENSEFREHYDTQTNTVVLSNGRYVENLELSNIPGITEIVALNNALLYVNAEIYAWQDDSMEFYLQLDSVPEMQTYYPQGELVFALGGDGSIVPANYKLAWKFRIFALTPHSNKYVYIDAQTGQFLKDEETECTGDFNHVYYGTKYIDTRWYGGLKSKYFLEANDNGMSILTKDDNRYDNGWALNKLPDDKDDHWGNSHWGGTSCHHVVQESWSMFKNKYGRNGTNNANKQIRVMGNDISNPSNAVYVNSNSAYDLMAFGMTSQGNLLATYDIAGHEFTHGVTNHTAGLVYKNQSGALNESFSDIFGLATERYAKGGSFNWTIGEDANFILRNMQLPSSLFNNFLGMNYPNWYLETGKWYSGTSDDGGVHHNSSVQNRYFYLLSMGGTQLSRSVSGVGVDIAANVSYYSLTNLTGSSENYPLAREHAIAAARILYGRCSNVEYQVCMAWSACNVGQPCTPCDILPSCWQYGCSNNSQYAITHVAEIKSDKNEITVYPNPANDILKIKISDLNNLQSAENHFNVAIVDIFGRTQMVRTLLISDFEKGLIIENLSVGVYSLVISNGEGFTRTIKFIKQ